MNQEKATSRKPRAQTEPAAAGPNSDPPEQQVIAGRSEIAQALTDLSSQNEFQRQQLAQLYAAVSQLYQAVSAQCQQLLQSDAALQQELQKELQKFQTGGPQRAMAGVFAKLFRDLLKHINELDDLIARNETQAQDVAPAWFDALRILRDSFEAILNDWGCAPVAIQLGVQEFDPEVHEAVAAEAGDVPAGAPEHIIVKIRRRGWIMNEQILQHPQVVVS